MVFDATFNDISAISWRSALLTEETTDLSQVADKLYHNVVSSTPRLNEVQTMMTEKQETVSPILNLPGTNLHPNHMRSGITK
jgi:hypothetical protein